MNITGFLSRIISDSGVSVNITGFYLEPYQFRSKCEYNRFLSRIISDSGVSVNITGFYLESYQIQE